MIPAFFYHIVTPLQWEVFDDSIYFETPSLKTEGFIHASTAEQVEATANRYYKDEPVIWLLKIEAARVNAELKYELATSVNEYFPHIYGPLNKDAILEVLEFEASEDGTFKIENI